VEEAFSDDWLIGLAGADEEAEAEADGPHADVAGDRAPGPDNEGEGIGHGEAAALEPEEAEDEFAEPSGGGTLEQWAEDDEALAALEAEAVAAWAQRVAARPTQNGSSPARPPWRHGTALTPRASSAPPWRQVQARPARPQQWQARAQRPPAPRPRGPVIVPNAPVRPVAQRPAPPRPVVARPPAQRPATAPRPAVVAAPRVRPASELPGTAASEAKRPKVSPAPSGGRVQLSKEVAGKLQALKESGIGILAPAVRALADAAKQDALVVLLALSKRGATVTDPTKWILNSLRDRVPAQAASPTAVPPAARPPTLQPAAQASAPAAPVARRPAAKAAAPPPKRQPPKFRQGLDFDRAAVQGKLQSLNQQGLWSGSHPLDESALAALLRLEPARALEILDEAEEKAIEGALKDPSAFARRAVALEEAKLKA